MRKSFTFAFVLLVLFTLVVTLTPFAQPMLPLPGSGNLRATTELLNNANFEIDVNTDKIPDGWTGKQTSIVNTDVLKCDKPGKLFAHSVPCAYMFRGNPGGSTSKLQQTITDTDAIIDGAEVTFSVYLDARSAAPNSKIGAAKISYSNGTSTKFALTVPAAAARLRGVADYQLLTDTKLIDLSGGLSITKAKVDFRYKGTTGKFLIDDASFLVVSSPPPGSPVRIHAEEPLNQARFGNAVGISSDTVVVGAHYTDVNGNDIQGAAYVFVYNGTTWVQQAQLIASDGAEDDYFGSAVAISDDTIIVGAPFKSDDDPAYYGAAYVFTRTGTTWTEQQKLTGSDGGGLFGYSVAIEGDTIVVGATSANAPDGAVYIFERDGNTWVEQQKLTVEDDLGIAFGSSVAISGDTIAIGKYVDSVGDNGNQGSAYIFTRSGGIWTEQQMLVASDGDGNDEFGWSIDISGDTVVVGARWDTIGSNDLHGSAYVFTRSGTVWTEQQKLLPNDTTIDEHLFGASVTISGDTIVVGAAENGINEDGAGYVYARSGTVWSETQKLLPVDHGLFINMGISAALDDDLTLILGAPFDDIGFVQDNQGSAFIFELVP